MEPGDTLKKTLWVVACRDLCKRGFFFKYFKCLYCSTFRRQGPLKYMFCKLTLQKI